MSSPVTNPVVIRQAGDDEAIDLLGMVHSIWDRKWSIAGLSIVVAIAAGFWMGTKPAIYEAKATLLIEQKEANLTNIKDVYSQDLHGIEYMQTQFEMLRSRSLAERVVRKLQLQKVERFIPQPPKPKAWYQFSLSSLKPAGANPQAEKPWVMPSEDQQITALTVMIAGSLKVVQNGESSVVTLTVTLDDPKLAASIANTYLEQYIESFKATKMEDNIKAQNSLTEGAADLKQKLKTAQEKLQAFREQEKVVDVRGASMSEQELSSITATHAQSSQRRIELEATQKELERLKGHGIDELMGVPAFANNESIRAMRQRDMDAQRIVGELSRRYGPKHPKMIEARAQAISAHAALESEGKKVEYALQQEYRQAQQSESASKARLETTTQNLQAQGRQQFILKGLEQDVASYENLYNMFVTRNKETGVGGVFDVPPAHILDLSLGGNKVGPDIQKAVMLALGLTFIVACGLAILLDTLDNTIKTPIDVEEKLGLALLGALPVLKKTNDGDIEEYWLNSKSEFAEAVRTIRTGVVLSGLDNPARIIVVTSSIPGEGKSTLALNLAASFSQMEKTLVIGADLRRPSLARKCKLVAKHPGLSNYVAGSAALEDCIALFGESNLSVMPAGIIPPNPLELLSSQKFRETLEFLKTRFDRIVIDSAPVAAVSDALMLASYADALIFVVKADDTTATLVKKSLLQLESASDRLTGVVLNHFDPSRTVKYYSNYKYSARYGGSYYNSTDTHG